MVWILVSEPWGHDRLQNTGFSIGSPELFLFVNWNNEILVAMPMLIKNKVIEVELPTNHLRGTKRPVVRLVLRFNK